MRRFALALLVLAGCSGGHGAADPLAAMRGVWRLEQQAPTGPIIFTLSVGSGPPEAFSGAMTRDDQSAGNIDYAFTWTGEVITQDPSRIAAIARSTDPARQWDEAGLDWWSGSPPTIELQAGGVTYSFERVN